MSKYLLPNIGSSGVVTLKAPFAALCAPGVPYRVTEIRMLQGIVSNGDDPYRLYYQPYEITQEDFAQDVRDGACILSLTSPDGSTVYVPNSYLLTLPVATGVPYTVMMVGVNLGALPQDLSLAYFMAKVQEMAHDLLGVTAAEVRAIKAGTTTYLTLEDAAAIETARKVLMAEVVTDAAKLYKSEQDRIALQTRNADLEAFIIANHIEPTP